MRQRIKISKDQRAVALALVATGLGVALAVLLQFIEISGSGTFITLIFFPVIVYLLASNKLDEIGGPGGWKLKLRGLASRPIAEHVGNPVEATNLEIIVKGTRSALDEIEQRLRTTTGAPFALTLRLGQSGYNAADILRYLRLMMAFDPALPVIFVQPDRTFAAASLGTKIASLLGEALDDRPDESEQAETRQEHELDSSAANAFVVAVTSGDLDALDKLVSITRKCIKPGVRNLEALQLMLSEDVDLLITVDTASRPVGLVKRDPLVAQMLSEILNESHGT